MRHGYSDINMWQDIVFFAIVFIPLGLGIGYLIWS